MVRHPSTGPYSVCLLALDMLHKYQYISKNRRARTEESVAEWVSSVVSVEGWVDTVSCVCYKVSGNRQLSMAGCEVKVREQTL